MPITLEQSNSNQKAVNESMHESICSSGAGHIEILTGFCRVSVVANVTTMSNSQLYRLKFLKSF